MATSMLAMGRIGIWTSRTCEFESPRHGTDSKITTWTKAKKKGFAPERIRLEKEVAAHPFFIGMGDRHVRLLADCAMRSHFHAGGVIFREGEAANRLLNHRSWTNYCGGTWENIASGFTATDLRLIRPPAEASTNARLTIKG